MNKIIKEYNSFKEADKDDIEYYSNLSSAKKIEELEIIRENFLNQINAKPEERRLQRVFEVIDRK